MTENERKNLGGKIIRIFLTCFSPRRTVPEESTLFCQSKIIERRLQKRFDVFEHSLI